MVKLIYIGIQLTELQVKAIDDMVLGKAVSVMAYDGATRVFTIAVEAEIVEDLKMLLLGQTGELPEIEEQYA